MSRRRAGKPNRSSTLPQYAGYSLNELTERLLDNRGAGDVEIVWDRWLHRACDVRPTVTKCWGVQLRSKVYR